MSDSRLINRICFEQVKKRPEVETTDLIELNAIEKEDLIKIEEKPSRGREKLTPRKVDESDNSVLRKKSEISTKFHLDELKVINEHLAYVLENQNTLHTQLLDLRAKKNGKIDCLICVNSAILVTILIVCVLSIIGIYLLFDYIR